MPRPRMLRTFARWQDVDPAALHARCAVVIDVLRWSSVAITALQHGAEAVEAWATPDEVRERARAFPRDRVLLGGERGNHRLPGFDAGNSPAEYGEGRVRGRTVLTTTTNGTQGILAAQAADRVLVGAFVNLDALVAELRAEHADGRAIALIACGQAGEPAEEDLACAGAIAEALRAHAEDEVTAAARDLWSRRGRDAARALDAAPHGAALRAAGFAGDVHLCARIGVFPCVPRLAGPHRMLASSGSPPFPPSPH